MKKYFHSFDFYAFSFSVLLYLLSSSINTKAAQWGVSYISIGLINFVGCLFYVLAASVLGRVGDRIGFKKSLSAGMLLMAVFLNYGFFWNGVEDIIVTSIAINVFFGFFFPSLEGLISKGEKREGIDPAMTVVRFVLSWSAGNMIGMAMGPYIIQRAPHLIFGYGIGLCLLSAVAINFHRKRWGETLPGPYRESLKIIHDEIDFPKIREYRRTYRFVFLMAGIVYTSGMALFPKLISSTGTSLENVGFLTVGANVGVFVSFIFMSAFKYWVGNPRKAFETLLVVFAATAASFFFPQTPFTFIIVTFLSGVTYAVPYIFAIFYGLNSKDDDHGKQGGIHESMVGIIFGVGPLIGGYFLYFWPYLKSMGVMAVLFISIAIVNQLTFIKKLKKS